MNDTDGGGLWSAGDGSMTPRTFGEPSTFGSAPWHDDRGWWKLAADGPANDMCTHFGRHHDVALAAVSLRGNRHRYDGTACQDAFAISMAGNDQDGRYVIAVVCDGMGSAKFSAFGARLVAQRFASLLVGAIDNSGPTWRRVIQDHQARILRLVTDTVLEFRPAEYGAPDVVKSAFSTDLAQTTMTFAVVPVYAAGVRPASRTVLLGYIGDSPAFVLSDGQWLRVHSEHEAGVWDSATDGVLGSTAITFVEGDIADDQALLLASDGVGNYLTFEGQPTDVGKELGTRWTQPVEWLEFVRDVSFNFAGADDDRTAVMIWPG